MKIIIPILIFLVSFNASAMDVIYGCSNGNWSTPACWSTGSIPGISDRAIIGATNTVEVSSAVTVGSVVSSGFINVTANGVLNVNGGLSLINQNLGTLDIFGTVNLEGGGVSLQSQNRVLVRTGGLLSVQNSASDGINSAGEIKVNIAGEIIVNNSSDYGVINSGGFENNGKVNIDGALTGFYQTGYTDSLVNNQIINIKNCTEFGLESFGGLIENYDRIRIENTTLAGLYAHGDNNIGFSEINNHEEAILQVYGGISNNNDFLNDGYIYCSGTGISSLSTGDLINNDTIIVSTKNSVGITFSGDFINNVGGVIISDSVLTTDGGDYFFASGSGGVENYGSFQFDLKDQANGLSHGSSGIKATFKNYETIEIKNAKKGLELKYFTNMTGGSIVVDSCSNTALTAPGDSAINMGEITLKNAQGGFGLTTLTFGSFVNKGLLNIENHQGDDGVYNYSNYLLNDTTGSIVMTYNGYGIAFNNPRGEFVNHGLVDVTLAGNADEGLYIGSNVAQKFNNYGTFNLRNESSAAVPNGIFAIGPMSIDSCSKFYTELPFQVEPAGSVKNYGLLSMADSASIHNEGVFNNYGLIEGLNGLYGNQLTLNNGLISSPVYHGLEIDRKYGSGLINDGGFTVSTGLFADMGETQQVATFSTDRSNYIVTGFETADTLRFTVDLFGECTYQLRMPILSSLEPNCPSVTENSFLANPDNNWFSVANWSLGKLPGPCEKVIIPGTQRADVLQDDYAEAKYIDIQSGAVFSTEEGAVLNFR